MVHQVLKKKKNKTKQNKKNEQKKKKNMHGLQFTCFKIGRNKYSVNYGVMFVVDIFVVVFAFSFVS